VPPRQISYLSQGETRTRHPSPLGVRDNRRQQRARWGRHLTWRRVQIPNPLPWSRRASAVLSKGPRGATSQLRMLGVCQLRGGGLPESIGEGAYRGQFRGEGAYRKLFRGSISRNRIHSIAQPASVYSGVRERESSLSTTFWSGSTDVVGGPASRHGSLNSLFQVALYLPS